MGNRSVDPSGKPVEPDAQQALNVRRYDDIIRQIREVISARVVVDSSGNIEEIHVLAGAGRNPKQIVRDIESAFMAHFGISVDHKKISIAQVQAEDERAVGAVTRVRLKTVSYTVRGRQGEARVEVELDDVTAEGVSTGPHTTTSRLRTMAAATLRAVERYFRTDALFALEDVVLVSVAQQQAVVVLVTLTTDGSEELFVGCAVVRPDAMEAVARAALDAINRRFALLARKN